MKREAEPPEMRDKTRANLFSKFGPNYPAVERFDNSVCLTFCHGTALILASGWKRGGSAMGILDLSNDKGRHLQLSYTPTTTGVSDVSNVIRSLAEAPEPFQTPGAILVVNHKFLHRHGLLERAKGEEDAIASYLPWRAIGGILHMEAGQTMDHGISGITLFDKSLRQNVLLTLGRFPFLLAPQLAGTLGLLGMRKLRRA